MYIKRISYFQQKKRQINMRYTILITWNIQFAQFINYQQMNMSISGLLR
uniref:Uncharacterized protein n=1 Tax=Ascaris lumbricoides TaxID=6252 RepID=A0A0M3IQH0_ASCLU